ncbi:RNA polymerase sigma-70 factor (ECF subfamily) [Chitinophaga skermanii]|uniref:RNA polymerase sigma-70 factor (ECF subfamily) n=1 Tax=Chitinophaga skermanii TaxID=331697 RepID=A0A327QWP2_9BACT|nr:sigma-70 family RNA polymerase sigma factor [Chitinophaga skermanii]RAJ08751.1 RNA polymerase sigma-70 factor (ECF subfamily) [Chitinophaga skermanii]
MVGEDSAYINDETLLQQVSAGNEQAFTTLYWRYSGALYKNFLKMVKDELLAEELLQDLFAKIWQKRESLQINSDFKGYLYRMGYNMVMDFYRKLQRDQTLLNHFKQVATENYHHIEEIFNLKDSQALLSNALTALSPQQRKVFELCRLEGKTYKEAAEILGISVHTVKEYFVKANLSVRTYLLQHVDISIGLMMIYIIHHSLS